MATLWKDILYPGRWHTRDGRTFVCGPEEIPHYARRMQDMIDAGLPVPLSWEHQPQLKPTPASDSTDESRAARAKFALGHASAVRSDSGFLETRLEVPSEEDAKRLPSVRFVSPFIEWNFRDGTGKVWEGPSITHIAVTPRPIQHTQQPFAMSQNGAPAPIALSMNDYEGPMDENEDPKKKKPPVDDDAGDEMETDTPPPSDESSGGLSDEEVPELVDLLSQHKIILGDGVTAANFCDRLKAALHTKAAHDGTGEGGINNPETQASAVEVGLSAEGQNWKTRAERAESKLSELEHKNLVGRIRQLGATGRVSKALRDQLLNAAQSVSLSLDAGTGAVNPTPLLYKIEAYEQLQPNRAFADHAALSAEAVEADPPQKFSNRSTQEKIGEEIAAMAGVRKAA